MFTKIVVKRVRLLGVGPGRAPAARPVHYHGDSLPTALPLLAARGSHAANGTTY